MPSRYLFGPITEALANQHVPGPRQRGECRVFDVQPDAANRADIWNTLKTQLPHGWQPDFLVLYLPYRVIPEGLWQAPVPIVGIAPDWNLQWHHYRNILRRCDLIFTDTLGVNTLAKAGITHVRVGCLFGCERQDLETRVTTGPRPIDVMFAGNSHAAIHKERKPWLARLGRMARRWNIQIISGVFGAEYRQLLRQSRIVFNRSIRKEWNMRIGETIAAGALLFQEVGNLEAPLFLHDRKECVYYDGDNFETLLEYYLEHENERVAIAQAAQARLDEFSFERFWEKMLGVIETEWVAVQERMQRRLTAHRPLTLSERTWQHLVAATGADATLASDLAAGLRDSPRNASVYNLQGIDFQTNSPTQWELAAHAFQNAWTSDPRQVMAGLNLAEMLALMGQKKHAIEQARRTLAILERLETLPAEVLEAPHAPPGFDWFRVEWEQAAWINAGEPEEEGKAKVKLLKWQLHALLGNLTGDLVHFFQSHDARPDLAKSKGTCGCALGRANRPIDAMPYLKSAYRLNPFDRTIARAYFHVLEQLGLTADQHVLIRERQDLAKAAPRSLPVEDWFAPKPRQNETGASTTRSLRIVWQGEHQAVHSLALVSREICCRLVARGHQVTQIPPSYQKVDRLAETMQEQVQCSLANEIGRLADFHISHQWPPDFRKPAQGRWIVMLHWEFGSLPRAWLEPLKNQVDEVWVASTFARDCFVQSGIPDGKVKIIPLGVGPELFQQQSPFPLKTKKRFRFLFVGGTLERKGFDLLLKAYHQVFSSADDVCLIVKDMGVGTFYKGQTAADQINLHRQKPYAPEVEYLDGELSTQEMAALFTACHCLVHPYRGEGFGLPIAEAMASGLPVIVTGMGACLDFCREEHAYLIPARMIRFSEKKIDQWETVDFPFWAEPDKDALRWLLRHVFEHQQEARAKGAKGRAFIRDYFTWDHTVAAVEARLESLALTPMTPPLIVTASSSADRERPRVSLTMIVRNEEQNLPACLDSIEGLVDEIIVVDTGSADATVNIAEKHGAKVYHFPWIDDFAAARNEALRHATGDWIFWLDADDRLDEANRRKLQKLFTDLPSEMGGFVMKCLCLGEQNSTSTIVDHIRLFSNHPDLRWRYRIHEQILLGIRRLGGKVYWSDVVIQHVGYQDAEVRQKKLARDFHLLELENQENPDDAFTLFNLGNNFLEQKKPDRALEILQRSLQHSRPTDSIVRKLYSMLAQCHRLLGNMDDANKICREGRQLFSNDPEILFQESILLQKIGDKRGAIACLLQLVEKKDESKSYFASVDTGISGCKGYHNLAVLYYEQGQKEEAEKFWQLAVENEPSYLPSLIGLGDLFLKQGRKEKFQEIMRRVEKLPRGNKEFQLLQARKLLAENQFDQAKDLVKQILQTDVDFLPAWIVLSHILLKQGKNLEEADMALQEIIKRDPQNDEARRNLDVLTRRKAVAWQNVSQEGQARQRVSFIMIVKNEEKNLPGCLDSVADLVDEMVIVDTGSADDTVNVARNRGAKVIPFTWIDDFAAARNESLRHATGEWILWMDADDRLDTVNRQKLRSLIASLTTEFVGFVMQYFCLPDPSTGTAVIVDRPRFLPNHPKLRWKYRVHEQIYLGDKTLAGYLRRTDVVIQHLGLQDTAVRRQKIERNLRLLQMEYQENPNDPFILYYLGSTFFEQKSPDKAVPFLQRGLEHADPTEALSRKLHSVLAQCHRAPRNFEAAKKICQAGRKLFADDPEILFEEGLALQKLGDKQGAIACLTQLVQSKDDAYYVSFDTGLRGCKGFHNLGVLYHETGLLAEAERSWRLALEKQQGYLPSLVSLGDLFLTQGRLNEFRQIIQELKKHPHGEMELKLLQGRKLLAENQFRSALGMVKQIIQGNDAFVPAWVVLSHILLKEGKDWKAAEKTLREILARDPANDGARQNLKILEKEMKKKVR